jgi:hypothetical protein
MLTNLLFLRIITFFNIDLGKITEKTAGFFPPVYRMLYYTLLYTLRIFFQKQTLPIQCKNINFKRTIIE